MLSSLVFATSPCLRMWLRDGPRLQTISPPSMRTCRHPAVHRLVHAFHARLGARVLLKISLLAAELPAACQAVCLRAAHAQVHAHECRPWLDKDGMTPQQWQHAQFISVPYTKRLHAFAV